MENSGGSDDATPGGGFNGYVKEIKVSEITDGSEPFDQEAGDGNDTGGNNKIVRTFDTIKYDVAVSYQYRDPVVSQIEENAELKFEASMYKKITEARFDTSVMSWLSTGKAEWEINYWARDSSDPTKEYIVLKEKKAEGETKLYRVNADGTEEETSINAIVNGSNEKDADGNSIAYQTNTGAIFKQTLSGTVHIEKPEESGTKTYNVGVRVRNAKNQDTFQPTFKAWFTKNEENYGVIVDGTSTPQSDKNRITANGSNAVTVSCAPLYNLKLEESTEYVNYLSWYDFSSGNQVTDANLLAYLETAGRLEENYGEADPAAYTNNSSNETVSDAYNKLTEEQKNNLGNIRFGRMNALGLTASLASEASPGTNKGYKGCSLPIGEMTFDLSLGVTTKVTAGENVDTDGYSAILWDYRPNASTGGFVIYEDADHTRQWSDTKKGTMDRNLLWNNIEFSQYGTRMAPAAYRGAYTGDNTVYDSGYWALTAIGGVDADRSTTGSANSVYTFTVRDYDFDLDNYLYPDRYFGASEASLSQGLGITDFAFFGGYAQVLYVMPYANKGAVEVKRNITLGNLELTDFSDQKLELAEGAERGKTVSADNEANGKDNTVSSSITQYSSGNFTKRNSFNTADATNHTNGSSGKSFLGSNFWGSPSWDESAYAGSNISIMGSAQLTSESDNKVRAVNLLQLFDSDALSITPKTAAGRDDNDGNGRYITQGEVDFGNYYENTYQGHDPKFVCLFAADPDHRDGYATNMITEITEDGVTSYSSTPNTEMVEYMNAVREDDLIYSDRLYWNDEDKCYNLVKYDLDGDGTIGGDETFTCVGVLSEVRDCCYLDYCYVRIPVTVANHEKFVSRTVCTVNAAVVWIDQGAMKAVSWKDGIWDMTAGKNTLEDYVEITSAKESPSGNGYTDVNWEGSFTKVEYGENGNYETGTAGKKNGASLLILGYKAGVHIDHQKNMDNPGQDGYAPGSGQTSVTWVVQDIKTELDTVQTVNQTSITSLTIPVKLTYSNEDNAAVNLQTNLYYITRDSSTITEKVWQTDADGNLALDANGRASPVYETDADGNLIQKTEVKTISTDPDHPTAITFLGTCVDEDNQTVDCLYTYTIYAVREEDRTGVTYYIDGAPVGQTLPEIRFEMNLGNSLGDNDKITATAAITGSGDRRAYSEAAGNQQSSTIRIAATSSTRLIKTVNRQYGEIGSEMKYTVTYTNDSDHSINKAYFYDNMPYNGDIRGSVYDMGETGTVTDGTIISNIDFSSRIDDKDSGDFQATVTVYYPKNSDGSSMSDEDFKTLMYGFQGTEYQEEDAESGIAAPDGKKLDALLDGGEKFGVLMTSEDLFQQADEASSGLYYKLKSEPKEDVQAIQDSDGTWYTKTVPSGEASNYENPSVTYHRKARFHRTCAEGNGWVTGYTSDGTPIYSETGEADYQNFLSTIPGVVVRVENMGPKRSLQMEITMKTRDNKAGDVYKNDAWQWTEGLLVLKSGIVDTTILGRTISGRVWADENLNGVYDEGEYTLNGVTCTLFRWDDEMCRYVPCTMDVAGRRIGTVTTGSYTYLYNRPDENGDTVTKEVEACRNTDPNGAEPFYRDEHGHEVTMKKKDAAGALVDDADPTAINDGRYRFDALPEGKYLVAFSGEALERYGGATTYHVVGGDAEKNNDGVALGDTPKSSLDTQEISIDGIDSDTYRYAIAYDLIGDNAVEDMVMHSIDDIVNNNIGLTNFVEWYDHQDLGLIVYTGKELPDTGGVGTMIFFISGLVLMLGAGTFLFARCRKG